MTWRPAFNGFVQHSPEFFVCHRERGEGSGDWVRHSTIDESVTQSRLAAELDPLSPQVFIDSVFALAWQGNYDEARKQVARAEYLDPAFLFVPFGLGWIDLQEGKMAGAVPHFEKATSMEAPYFAIAWLGYAYGASGDRERALKTIDELNSPSLNGYESPFNLAIIYLGMGENEKTLSYLEQARNMDTQWVGWWQRDKIFDPLRSEPRFQKLLVKGYQPSSISPTLISL